MAAKFRYVNTIMYINSYAPRFFRGVGAAFELMWEMEVCLADIVGSLTLYLSTGIGVVSVTLQCVVYKCAGLFLICSVCFFVLVICFKFLLL